MQLHQLKKLAAALTANVRSQQRLEKAISKAQLLLGIGAGGVVGTSGEAALFRQLKREESNEKELCLFDVGANRGQFLDVALAELDSIAFKIHCFEPSAATFKMLIAGRPANSKVILNPCGLGNARGEATLYYDQQGSGLASLTRRRLEHFEIDQSLSERVTLETLDRYCEDRGIENIDLLKIDVEGHEMDVLLGAERMLAQSVGMVTFEFGGCNIDTRTYFQDFFYFFKTHDMSLYRITPSGFFYPIPRYQEELEQFRTTNFVATRRRV